MKVETFDMVAWDNVETTLKEASKMFKMWHINQGSGFCGVGYWARKGQKDGGSRCLSCRGLNKNGGPSEPMPK